VLLKVGVIMMALALALVIAAAVVSVALGSVPEWGVTAEVAKKPPGEVPRHSSGEEGSATKKSSSEKESPSYPSGEEQSLGYGSSSPSDGSVRQRKEDAKEPQPVAAAFEPERSKSQSEMPQAASQQTPSEAQQHEDRLLPAAEDTDWPRPTHQELEAANKARHYNLPAGAIMGLTIEAIGIYNAPVFDSDSQWALANGVAHVPETSLPWSPTAQRNVFLAGHRMGYRGTWSRMIFYSLGRLGKGDRIVLKDRTGRSYEYRVSETFLAEPADSWVMGQVRGRDMLTLQTCTPIPTFQKRLIVRADRV